MFIIPALTKLLYFRIFEFYLHFGSCCGKTINRTYDFIRQLTERIMAKHVDLNDIHVQIYKRYNKINTYKIRNFSLIFFSTIKSLLPSLCTSWGTLMHKSLLSKSCSNDLSGKKNNSEGIRYRFYSLKKAPSQWKSTNHQCTSSSAGKNSHLFWSLQPNPT